MSYRDYVNDRLYRKAEKRLSKVTSGEVISWTNQALVASQIALDNYERQYDDAALHELRLGIISMLAAVDVLRNRA